VIERLFEGVSGLDLYRQKLSKITNTANELLFKLVSDMTYAYEKGKPPRHDASELERKCGALTKKLLTLRDAFVLRNQPTMLRTLGVEEEMEESRVST